MNAAPTDPIPEPCRAALEAIEAAPLHPGEAAERHTRHCPACAEARVLWLAQEDSPVPLAPAGYFEQLPGRVLRKLPTRPRRRWTPGRLTVLAAAGLLMAAMGVGGFWLGRAHRAPVVEATNTPAEDTQEALPEAPFQEEHPLEQLPALSEEEAKALFQRLERPTR